MRSTFKTVFYVNGSKEKNGIVPIMGRVTTNGTIWGRPKPLAILSWLKRHFICARILLKLACVMPK